MNLQDIEQLRKTKTIRAVHSSIGLAGLSRVATGATLPGARQEIIIDPETGFPDETALDTDGPFLAGDPCGSKAVG